MGLRITDEADLVVVQKSLSAYPFEALPGRVKRAVNDPIYNEPAGGICGRASDVLLLGGCYGAVSKQAKELGWTEGLEEV